MHHVATQLFIYGEWLTVEELRNIYIRYGITGEVLNLALAAIIKMSYARYLFEKIPEYTMYFVKKGEL